MVGGLSRSSCPERVLELVFAGLLVYVAVTMARRRDRSRRPGDADGPAPWSRRSPAASGRPGRSRAERGSSPARRSSTTLSGPGYRVRRLGYGIVGSVGAGVASRRCSGSAAGSIKVPVMHVVMGVPLRVATATSNLMIGITASASAIIYLLRGGIDPYAAAPTAIGVFIGASIGSRIAHRIDLRILRGLFVAILLYTAWQMLQRAIA